MTTPSQIRIIEIPGFSEPFSSMSHLLAAGIFLILGTILVFRHRHSSLRVIGLVIFITGVIFTLAMSGVFHLLTPGSTSREVLQRLDHAGIFFLIAASFTPLHLLLFKGIARWGILVLVWTCAITGLTLKSIYFNDIPEWLGLTLQFIKPLLYGSLAYTFGALIDFTQTPILIAGVLGPHELFHVGILFGVGFHWAFVARAAEHHRTRTMSAG
jgi:predicted membrane channel-forming protein YqfA (hemolysin III family)